MKRFLLGLSKLLEYIAMPFMAIGCIGLDLSDKLENYANRKEAEKERMWKALCKNDQT